MTDETKTPEPAQPLRKRRTVDEIRAYHEAELKRLAEREKAEVIRLLAHAHDLVAEAHKMPAAKAVNMGGIVTSLGAVIKAIEAAK